MSALASFSSSVAGGEAARRQWQKKCEDQLWGEGREDAGDGTGWRGTGHQSAAV